MPTQRWLGGPGRRSQGRVEGHRCKHKQDKENAGQPGLISARVSKGKPSLCSIQTLDSSWLLSPASMSNGPAGLSSQCIHCPSHLITVPLANHQAAITGAFSVTNGCSLSNPCLGDCAQCSSLPLVGPGSLSPNIVPLFHRRNNWCGQGFLKAGRQQPVPHMMWVLPRAPPLAKAVIPWLSCSHRPWHCKCPLAATAFPI